MAISLASRLINLFPYSTKAKLSPFNVQFSSVANLGQDLNPDKGLTLENITYSDIFPIEPQLSALKPELFALVEKAHKELIQKQKAKLEKINKNKREKKLMPGDIVLLKSHKNIGDMKFRPLFLTDLFVILEKRKVVVMCKNLFSHQQTIRHQSDCKKIDIDMEFQTKLDPEIRSFLKLIDLDNAVDIPNLKADKRQTRKDPLHDDEIEIDQNWSDISSDDDRLSPILE